MKNVNFCKTFIVLYWLQSKGLILVENKQTQN